MEYEHLSGQKAVESPSLLPSSPLGGDALLLSFSLGQVSPPCWESYATAPSKLCVSQLLSSHPQGILHLDLINSHVW